MICILCKENKFEKVYSLKTKNILHCKNDGLFVAQKTREDKTYGKEYFSNEPNKFNWVYFLKKLILLKRLVKLDKPKILDVGCGWGDFEEVLEKERIPYLGIDINKEAIEICKKKGLNCSNITLEQYNNKSKRRFDCITLFQVIEHFKNPLPILKTAKQLLKPGGIFLITTPNNDSPLRRFMGASWSVYTEPSHYLFFNKATLKKTLEMADFRSLDTQTDNPRFLSSTYILNRLLKTEYKLSFFPSLPIPTDPFGDLQAIAVK